jgi:hypothetical protein
MSPTGPQLHRARDLTTPHPSLGEARQRRRNFEAELSALEKGREVQSVAGGL